MHVLQQRWLLLLRHQQCWHDRTRAFTVQHVVMLHQASNLEGSDGVCLCVCASAAQQDKMSSYKSRALELAYQAPLCAFVFVLLDRLMSVALISFTSPGHTWLSAIKSIQQ